MNVAAMRELKLVVIPGSSLSHPMKEKVEGISRSGRVCSKSLRPFEAELNIIVIITFEVIRIVADAGRFHPFNHGIAARANRRTRCIIENDRVVGVQNTRLRESSATKNAYYQNQ